jgi:hypothetical protein
VITPSRSILSLSALAVIATVIATLAAIALPQSADANPGPTRYASPAGSGTACSAPHPCSLLQAVNHSTGSGQVVVRPGSYGSGRHPITQPLVAEGSLVIHGIAGGAVPVIHSSASDGVKLEGATLRDVRVDSTGATAAVVAIDGLISHVIADSAAAGAAACESNATIVDSVCVSTAPASAAVATGEGSSGPGIATINPRFRGDTFEAAASNSVGVYVDAKTFTTINLNATNDIIHGGLTDVEASTDAATSTVNVTLSHCDFRTDMTVGATGSHTVTGTATVNAAPHFVNQTQLNFRETASSPTIDKGVADPASDTDVVDRPRTVGRAPDIGAYEFLQRPTINRVKRRTVTSDSVTFSAGVIAEGLKTRVRLLATHGHTHLSSPWVDGHIARVVRHMRLTLRGLAAGQKYAVRVEAMNVGGTAKSVLQSVTTR